VTRAEINRLVDVLCEMMPDGRLARWASEEERLVMVARVVDAVWPVLGVEARRARAPRHVLPPAKRGRPVAPGVERRRRGQGKDRPPGALVERVERRLAHWLPPGVERLDAAKAWCDQERTRRALHAG
jgi:hypothetical protein